MWFFAIDRLELASCCRIVCREECRSHAMRRHRAEECGYLQLLMGDRHAPDNLSCWIDRGDPRHPFLLRTAVSTLMTVIVEEQPTYSGEIPPSNYLAWTPAVTGALIATA